MEKKKKIMIGVITAIVLILLIVAINIIVTNVLGEEERTNTASVENIRVNGETDNTANVRTSINTGDNQSNENVSTVYFTSDITSEGLLNIYHALGFEPEGNVAIKLSTGEMGGNNYLQPDLIDDLVQEVDGTIVENNTAYGGSRSSTAAHLQTAEAHGFTEIADVDILDSEGSMTLPVENGTHLQENLVGSHYANYDSTIVLSHFKGHAMAGFGGAIKNISIGFASREGKCLIHTAGESRTSFMGGDQDSFLESMAESALSVANDKGDDIIYINVMNNLSIDCDCDSSPSEPDMHDIGILASTDPVAVDKACIDLVYEQQDGDGASLVNRIESRNGTHTLDYAEQIGLGNLYYRLVDIDVGNT